MDSGASPWGEFQLEALARGELVYAMNEGWVTLSEGVRVGLNAWAAAGRIEGQADLHGTNWASLR